MPQCLTLPGTARAHHRQKTIPDRKPVSLVPVPLPPPNYAWPPSLPTVERGASPHRANPPIFPTHPPRNTPVNTPRPPSASHPSPAPITAATTITNRSLSSFAISRQNIRSSLHRDSSTYREHPMAHLNLEGTTLTHPGPYHFRVAKTSKGAPDQILYFSFFLSEQCEEPAFCSDRLWHFS